MKTILLSIKSKWIEKIVNKEKTIEVRKSAPKEIPFKVLLYCTKGKPYLHRIDDDEFVIENNKQENDDTYTKFYGDYNGKVIGEFICDKIDDFHNWELNPSGKYQKYEQERLDKFLKDSCLTYEEVCGYRQNLPYYKPLFAWHISDLKIYDNPKELSEFGIIRAPQSWVYVKGHKNEKE